jgi:hypothetical protein
MVPGAMAAESPMPAQPVQSVYNPTPPVKPVVKKTAGCMGIIGGALTLTAFAGLVLALIAHQAGNWH